MRKRWKRKSGYTSPRPTISIKEIVRNNFFLTPVYNDWRDWRDSMRDWVSDYKLIKKIPIKYEKLSGSKKRLAMNRKQRKLLLIRKKKKAKQNLQRIG